MSDGQRHVVRAHGERRWRSRRHEPDWVAESVAVAMGASSHRAAASTPAAAAVAMAWG